MEQVLAKLIFHRTAGSFHFLSKPLHVFHFFLASILLSGCSTKPLRDPILGPDHTINNVYRKEGILPGNVRRVAVLPLSFNESDGSGASAREILEPIVRSELGKIVRFETFFVKPPQMHQWSGKERWDDYEELPQGFLKVLAERTGCDAILFTRNSHFKAYPPMVIGWRMRLVTPEADVLWTVDEVFDASEEGVSNSARRYERGHTKYNPVLEDSRSILLSPTKFGQYTLSTIFRTVPVR